MTTLVLQGRPVKRPSPHSSALNLKTLFLGCCVPLCRVWQGAWLFHLDLESVSLK